MSVGVRTMNNETRGRLSVSLEIDDGSGELVIASFTWRGDMESVRTRYDKLLHKTVSVRGTPYTRYWNEGRVVSLDMKAVDLLDFAGEMEAIDNRMYTLEQLNLAPTFEYSRELPDVEQSEVRFLDYEVMSFKNAVSFTDVERGVEGDQEVADTGKGKEGKETEGGKEGKEGKDGKEKEDKMHYPNLAKLFRLPSAGKPKRKVQIPKDVEVIDIDEEEEVVEEERPAGGKEGGHETGDQETGQIEGQEVDQEGDHEVEVIEEDSEEDQQEEEQEVIEEEEEEGEEEVIQEVVETVEAVEPVQKSVSPNPASPSASPNPSSASLPPPVEIISSSDDEFGIMNKFKFKSSSPQDELENTSRSSSPVVVDFSSSNSQHTEPDTTRPRSVSTKRNSRPEPPGPKFKNTVVPALKRRKYTPDRA
ncbi:hypothetical protein CJU90_5688 [Yarrowia sp. C11]|nr:hypothetical protein CJU90_5688 [Yarrowia sp. C11]KAG5364272.1 hypothetical protein CKK34_3066 [Yarrowia sp. E02]